MTLTRLNAAAVAIRRNHRPGADADGSECPRGRTPTCRATNMGAGGWPSHPNRLFATKRPTLEAVLPCPETTWAPVPCAPTAAIWHFHMAYQELRSWLRGAQYQPICN